MNEHDRVMEQRLGADAAKLAREFYRQANQYALMALSMGASGALDAVNFGRMAEMRLDPRAQGLASVSEEDQRRMGKAWLN